MPKLCVWPGHCRLSLQAVRRQGHAARLMQQLECVLQGAGLQQLAVVLEPDVSGPAAACAVVMHLYVAACSVLPCFEAHHAPHRMLEPRLVPLLLHVPAATTSQWLGCSRHGDRSHSTLAMLPVTLYTMYAAQGNKEEVPGVPGAAAVEHWLLRAGFKLASAEQAMLWRRELPEYHRNLVAGCSLLVKPLGSSKAKRWF